MAEKARRSTALIARHKVRFARDTVLRRKSRFLDSLALLNSTIARTPFAERYWIYAGLLLGWARNGTILRNDYRDADFAFMAQDRDRFIAALEPLYEVGFRPFHRWRNNDGRTTEWVIQRDGARFEFFEFDLIDAQGFPITEPSPSAMFRYYGYFPRGRSWAEALAEQGDSIEQIEVHIPYQERTNFNFLGSTWCKLVDHELDLESLYGPRWRAEDKVFYNTPWMTSRDSPAIHSRCIWNFNNFDWDGDTAGG